MSADFLNLEVVVNPEIKGYHEGSICFETGLTRDQVSDPVLYAYDHHGEGFNQAAPGALTCLLEDILQGRPMPLKFVTPRIRLDTIFAITLFLHRDLATHPSVPGIIASVDLVHRRGLPMYGHVDSDLTRFFGLLEAMFSVLLSKKEQGAALGTAVGWIYEFVYNGNLPHLGSPIVPPTVLNVGSNGFVFASTEGDLHAGWVELYRQGYLRGVLIGREGMDRTTALASRKSVYVDLNLSKAAEILNEMECAMGEEPFWRADEQWLSSPPGGTLLLPSQILELLIRL